MMFFTIILVLFILLILISVINSLIFFALKLVTREHYKEHSLILPSLLTIILWFISYYILVKIISYITGIGILDTMSGILFNNSNLGEFIVRLIFYTVITLITTLLLQSLILLTVNINYTVPYNKFRYFIKGKLKFIRNKIKKNEESQLICSETTICIENSDEQKKLTFINSFICSLFIFSLLFFLAILFFWVGTLIGHKAI